MSSASPKSPIDDSAERPDPLRSAAARPSKSNSASSSSERGCAPGETGHKARHRTGPELNQTNLPPPSGQPYEALHDNVQQDEGRPTGRLGKWMLVLATFVLGSVVGIAASWWLAMPAMQPLMPPVGSEPLSGLAAPPAGQAGGRPALRGIRASELPYDGEPPPNSSADPLASDLIMSSPAPAAEDALSSIEEPIDSTPAPVSATPTPGRSMVKKDLDEPREAVDPGKLKSAQQSVKSEKIAPVIESEKTKAASSKVTASPLKDKNANAAKGIKKSEAASQRNHEIERIRQQANEELKKKTDTNRRKDAPAAKNRQAKNAERRSGNTSSAQKKVASVRAMVASCERAANFIRREQCKWRICGGRWGKNGCPSYTTARPDYLM